MYLIVHRDKTDLNNNFIAGLNIKKKIEISISMKFKSKKKLKHFYY